MFNRNFSIWELTNLKNSSFLHSSSEMFRKGILLASTPVNFNPLLASSNSNSNNNHSKTTYGISGLLEFTTDEEWLRNDKILKNDKYYPCSSSNNVEISFKKHSNDNPYINSSQMFDSAIAMSDSMSSETVIDTPLEIDSQNSNTKFKGLAAKRTRKSSGAVSNVSSCDSDRASISTAGIVR